MGPRYQEKGGTKGGQTGIETFVSELAAYYMDFLETDFHKHRLPKRSIRYRDDRGLFLGLNTGKYDGFSERVWKAISEGFSKDGRLVIRRGQHTTGVPKQILDLIGRRVGEIGAQDIQSIIVSSGEAINEETAKHKTEADIALQEAVERIQKAIREILVDPLLQCIERPISSQDTSAVEIASAIEQGLTEALTSFLEDTVSDCVNRIIAGQQCDPSSELKSAFSVGVVQAKMKEYFASLAVNDLYFELQELVDNKHIKDKTEVYVYFTDVVYGKNAYPVFYMPLTVEKRGDMFSLVLDSLVYINKKALEYILQEFNRETGRHGRITSIKQRILYPREHGEAFISFVQEVVDDIADCFQLPQRLDVRSSRKQIVKGTAVRLSNQCHLCIFDKSDEALVNDYEEILEALASPDHPLREIFNELVKAFIEEEPIGVRQEVHDEWDKAGLSDRLVYSSPIPLNAEQRQVLMAIKNERCRYIAVEGPPGTGKSHTITAIAFEAIRDGKSVLVLSDKKEALDVVEEKITDTMNNVRVIDNFQNPILRLGRSGNTYSQILSNSSIHNIEASYRAVKNDLGELRSNIEERHAKLRDWIRQMASVYGSISIRDIFRFVQLERVWGGESQCPLDIQEFGEGKESADTLENFVAASEYVEDSLASEHAWGSVGEIFFSLTPEKHGLRQLKGTVALLNVGALLRERHGPDIRVLKAFRTIKDVDYDILVSLVRECESLGAGWLGFMFKGRRLKDLNERFSQQLGCIEFVDVRRSLDDLRALIRILEDAKEEGARQHVTALLMGRLDYLKTIHDLLCRPAFDMQTSDLSLLLESIDEIEGFTKTCPASATKIGLREEDAATISSNKISLLDRDSLSGLLEYITLRTDAVGKFNSLPRFDYRRNLEELEELLTHEMTYLLDDRLLNFHENNRSTAATLRTNIRQKRRFPINEFGKLKEAFPCIIAGIRDYSEYIPLEPEIFDLVVIDEASQVSIAQAFPALIRAKKVIVLGDKKQFSNVKSAQARSDTNRDWLNRLEVSFRSNVSSDPAQLQRLQKFDIKTSILEFFEFITNFDVMLLKHFRGYLEHISYSSEHFYGGNLQAIKIRGKPIDDVLKFTFITHDSKIESIENTNSLEVDFVISELRKLKDSQAKVSVGVITPHTNQQKLIASEISRLPDRDYFYDKLKLRVMTFDTCQGEERDVVYYSMVANPVSDRLWGVFLKDLSEVDFEATGRIKAQRLNVGFSRVKECMHFVLSKPIDQFNGSIREAIQHYHNKLEEGRRLPTSDDVDPKSLMEPKVLEWMKNTKFLQLHSSAIDLRAQFPVGEYLKQLDRFYTHPRYRTDFLLIYSEPDGTQHKIIIEYDGFNEHFEKTEAVTKVNWDQYYTERDIEREKVLESYGYKFIRVNRFNLGKDPIRTLNERLEAAVERRAPGEKLKITSRIHNTIGQISERELKECPRCRRLKKIADFLDSSLATGEGRVCNDCKDLSRSRSTRIVRQRTLQRESQWETKSVYRAARVLCPKCRSEMVLRTGRHGKFYGCSRFPRCNGTRKH